MPLPQSGLAFVKQHAPMVGAVEEAKQGRCVDPRFSVRTHMRTDGGMVYETVQLVRVIAARYSRVA